MKKKKWIIPVAIAAAGFWACGDDNNTASTECVTEQCLIDKYGEFNADSANAANPQNPNDNPEGAQNPQDQNNPPEGSSDSSNPQGQNQQEAGSSSSDGTVPESSSEGTQPIESCLGIIA